MTKHRAGDRQIGPPEPYDAGDPAKSGAWPPGSAPNGPQVVKQGRDNETAAGEHIATAPDLDLGASGGGELKPSVGPAASPTRVPHAVPARNAGKRST